MKILISYDISEVPSAIKVDEDHIAVGEGDNIILVTKKEWEALRGMVDKTFEQETCE